MPASDVQTTIDRYPSKLSLITRRKITFKTVVTLRMSKSEMRVLHYRAPTIWPIRAVIASILTVLCLPIFFYHLVPSFTHATDDFMDSISTRILRQQLGSDFCTSDVGSPQCCLVYLDAQPCLDECQKQHIDRVSFALTREYDECADQCLVKYNTQCQRAENGNPFAGTVKGW